MFLVFINILSFPHEFYWNFGQILFGNREAERRKNDLRIESERKKFGFKIGVLVHVFDDLLSIKPWEIQYMWV